MEVKTIIWIFIIIFFVTAVITLLGITNVIKGIREKYLNKLFYTLIIEVVIAVVAVFKGVDFKNQSIKISTILERADISMDSNDEQRQADYLVEQIKKARMLPQFQEKMDKTEQEKDSLQGQLQIMQVKIDSCSNSLDESEQSFYSKVTKLRKLIVKYSGSINLLFKAEEKKEVFALLEDIFEILGTLNENDSGNIPALQKQYKSFELRHGLYEEGKLMIIEYETSILIREYLNKVSPVK